MSLVPANININIIAAYTGNHRVCYRIGDTGPYTCAIISCAGGNTPCSTAIPIFVDNETCDPIQFNGYVQPSCIDVASTDEQVPFSVTFTPSPSCVNYNVTCESSGVASPTITDPGNSYDPISPPAVLFTGGGGTGVTGVAVVGTGSLLSAGITDAGSGYTNGIYTNVDITGGSGSGAQATVTVVGGVVTSVVISAVGTGYSNGDTLGLDYTDMGMGSPPVTEAELTAVSDYGTIIGITITAPGSGYTTAPTITIGVSGGGTQAFASGNLLGCPAINTTGCGGSDVVIPANTLNVGDSISICNIGGIPSLDPVYSAVESGNCLCSGVSATIGISGSVGQEVRYFYNRIGGGVINGILIVGGSPSQIIDCVVPGSVVFQEISDAVGTVMYGGAC